MFEIRVDSEFAGPTLAELEPIMDALADPLEVRWSASRSDLLGYERNAGRQFILVVPDVEAGEKTLWVLGGPLSLSPEDLETAKKALTSRSDQVWRGKAEGLGTTRATLLLVKVTADSLRAGRIPKAALSITSDCLHARVNPADADVLLRLRTGLNAQ